MATTSDVFNAVAEPQRRRVLELLAQGEQSVNDVAQLLDMRQPQASKHLRVLREVGLVHVRGAGKQRLYTVNGKALKPIHDWIKPFEQMWSERMTRLENYLEGLKKGGDGK